MARANRHHLPGYVWHITHRCPKREFLKFDKDKSRWIHWLFEAKKRFGQNITANGSRRLRKMDPKNAMKWTQSIAVGHKEFVMETKDKLGAKAIGRRGMKNMSLRNAKVLTTVFLTMKSAT